MIKHIIFICIVLFFSCENEQSKSNKFKIPIISQDDTKDSIEFFKANYISEVWPRFAGKYSFSDTLKLFHRLRRDSTFDSDFIDHQIDLDTLTTDGFELVSDYKSTIGNFRHNEHKGKYYFPVYLINETYSTKILYAKDSYVYAIQEALDSNNHWRAIETKGFDFCGNGTWELKVHPNEFICFLMPKYTGDYNTKLRVRIKNNYTVYVSKPFNGTINYNQFKVDKNSYMYDWLKKNGHIEIYGARCLPIDEY